MNGTAHEVHEHYVIGFVENGERFLPVLSARTSRYIKIQFVSSKWVANSSWCPVEMPVNWEFFTESFGFDKSFMIYLMKPGKDADI